MHDTHESLPVAQLVNHGANNANVVGVIPMEIKN